MSSLSIFPLLSTAPGTTPRSSFSPSLPLLFPTSFLLYRTNGKRLNFGFRQRCCALSKPRSQENADVLRPQNGHSATKSREIVEDAQEEAFKRQVSVWNEIKRRVETIKSMLSSMEDGETSTSAYDTAWVALVKDLNGSGTPQFPSALQWIVDNQLSDGSWGDNDVFEAHDRLINALACVIALKSWNIHPDKCEKGLAFFKQNLCKLEDEDPEHMPIGFEVAFPSLLVIARSLGIEIPDDSPVLKEIYDRRNIKLSRIPKSILHKVPTTLLHSLEGMEGLDWEKILKLQCEDGSFLFSPASTAFALMQTKDEKCLAYLNKTVQRFKGGVPSVYPVDLFEHVWAIDRLQRLGISRYFQPEIKECVEYIHRYWTGEAICWARNSQVHDIDDTAMGFRILRLHGYEVSPDVFKSFEKDGEFCCFSGQSSQAVTGMFNLYRASQVLFPGEKILEDGRKYSFQFLRQKRVVNKLHDKWIITKDLAGEVGYALDIPWYASLPRLESRFFIEQYGGEDDVWIGKTLYRMPYVNNNEYLQLAKLDYNNCQETHRVEWDNFLRWYEECNLGDFGLGKRSLLLAYYLAAASMYEPERSRERLAWARTRVLLDAIESYFNQGYNFVEQRGAFVHEFKNASSMPAGHANGRSLDAKKRQELVKLLLATLNDISMDALVARGRDIGQSLRDAWGQWLLKWEGAGDRHQGEAELLVQTINLAAGRWISEEHSAHHPLYQQLAHLTNGICLRLGHYQKPTVQDNGCQGSHIDNTTTPQIESDMQKLVQLVFQNNSGGTNHDLKETYFSVARTFYYSAICDPFTIYNHIARVLFERVF